MSALRASASCVELVSDDSMVIAGSILAHYAKEQEGKLRACALVLEADSRLCIVTCDVIGASCETLDRAAKRIESECGIAFENILICGSHTHHAPSTFTVHGYKRDETFLARLEEAIVSAAKAAAAKLSDPAAGANDLEVEMGFALAQEATVGRNSRLLLSDGTIAWCAFKPEEEVRPTGPFDPDLAVIAFRRPDGRHAAVLFNHSTHNIGGYGKGRSPGFYGLAAQEMEEKIGAATLFLPGAFGSTHNQGVKGPECVLRIKSAVERGLSQLRWGLRGPVLSVKKPFEYQVRRFDEKKEDSAVVAYCEKRFPPATASAYIEVFRKMRKELALHQEETRRTRLQVLLLGDVALVGVPGEMFASLGMAIRRRSPFRHTFVVGLANDEIGYIPDREGMDLGGYQVWTGFHSVLPAGTGERMVDEAVAMLEQLHARGSDADAAPSPAPVLRPLREGDAPALQLFFNTLSPETRRLFRPAGWNMSLERCRAVVADCLKGLRYDLVVEAEGRIVGWAWIGNLDKDVPLLGIGISERYSGRGLGKELMGMLVVEGKLRGKRGISLTVVRSNERARRLYEQFDFQVTGSHTGGDGQEYYAMQMTY